MNEKFLPTTHEGWREQVIEECAEVIQAIQKLKRFGPGGRTEGKRNDVALQGELLDLERAIVAFRKGPNNV